MRVVLVEFENQSGAKEAEAFSSLDSLLQWLSTALNYSENEVDEFQRDLDAQVAHGFDRYDISNNLDHYFTIYPNYEVK